MLLLQGKAFDSLHWFETVTIRHQQDMQELKRKQQARLGKEKKGRSSDKQKEEDEIHTLQVRGPSPQPPQD